MSRQQHHLDTYGEISATTGRMLEAAKNGDWDRLIALEQDCRALIQTLKLEDPIPGSTSNPNSSSSASASTPYLRRKVELIRKVLADDAEIRKLTEPWMTRLELLFGTARQEHRLRRAYESDRGR
jgi:flagellar protein FliT